MTSLEALKLAVLFHDPPWKPWTVLRKLPNLHEKLYNIFKKDVDDALSRAGCSKYESLLGNQDSESSRKPKAHELQGILFLAVLADRLRDTPAEETALEALKLLCKRDSRVNAADRFSSALDRLVIYAAEKALGKELKSTRLVYKNPFEPELAIENSPSLSIDNIKKFIELYVDTVAGLVRKACSSNRSASCSQLLLHTAFLLMEPLWYLVFPKQAPPADTRVPGHTVFDHASAAMAMANWFTAAKPSRVDEDTTPEGYIVVVDLASVQSWIAEARRLRDMWAASWLASFLAWKTVEPFVERYGPDVLLQPPARLHPFYTAWLLSKLGFKSWSSLEDEARKNSAASVLRVVLRPWFQGWPIDPTVPSRVTMVLPREAGSRQELEEAIASSYAAAWREVARELASYVEKLVKALRQGDAGNLLEKEELRGLRVLLRLAESKDIQKLLESLEPPLPLRVIVIDTEEAYQEYARWLDENQVWSKAKDRLVEGGNAIRVLGELESSKGLLFYAFLQLEYLPSREKRAIVRASRRSGKGYLEYAHSMYSAYLGTGGRSIQPRLCTVCGRAIALIDPPEPGTDAYRDLMKNLEESRDSIAARLLAEARGERLCPYCLAKRTLRTMLQLRAETARRLVGLELEKEHKRKLVASSVDAYTSRLHVNRTKLAKALEDLMKKLDARDIHKLYTLVTSGYLSYHGTERWLKDAERSRLIDIITGRLQEAGDTGDDNAKKIAERLVGALESSIPSLLVDAGLRDTIAKAYAASDVSTQLVKALEEAAGYGSAYYAVVAADGDSMGRGVLQGRLGVDPRGYMEKLLEVADPDARSAIAEAFAALVDALDEALKEPEKDRRDCEPVCPERRLTLIVTPSYHYTVSRALASSATIDRSIVEKLGGFLVYAGGDDLVAVLPPGTEDTREEGVPYPALAAAIATRRSYWGLRAHPNGFHVYVPGTGSQEDSATPLGVIVPAIRGAGRSTVVYYAHAKTPMWLVFRSAHDLLDAKDGVAYLQHEGGNGTSIAGCKDVLVVASEASGVALMPFTLGLEPNGYDTGLAGALVEAVLFAVEECRAKSYEPVLSASIIRDLVGDTSLLARLSTRDARAALSLVEHHLIRNCCERKLCKKLGEEDEYATLHRITAAARNELDSISARTLGSTASPSKEATTRLAEALVSTATAVKKDSEVTAILERSGLATELGQCLKGAPLAAMVFYAAGITRTAARRPPRQKETTSTTHS